MCMGDHLHKTAEVSACHTAHARLICSCYISNAAICALVLGRLSRTRIARPGLRHDHCVGKTVRTVFDIRCDFPKAEAHDKRE